MSTVPNAPTVPTTFGSNMALSDSGLSIPAQEALLAQAARTTFKVTIITSIGPTQMTLTGKNTPMLNCCASDHAGVRLSRASYDYDPAIDTSIAGHPRLFWGVHSREPECQGVEDNDPPAPIWATKLVERIRNNNRFPTSTTSVTQSASSEASTVVTTTVSEDVIVELEKWVESTLRVQGRFPPKARGGRA